MSVNCSGIASVYGVRPRPPPPKKDIRQIDLPKSDYSEIGLTSQPRAWSKADLDAVMGLINEQGYFRPRYGGQLGNWAAKFAAKLNDIRQNEYSNRSMIADVDVELLASFLHHKHPGLIERVCLQSALGFTRQKKRFFDRAFFRINCRLRSWVKSLAEKHRARRAT